MISKSQIKLITSLGQKKYRDKTGMFVAEGPKIIKDLLGSEVELSELFSTAGLPNSELDFTDVSEAELFRISFLKTPNTAVALFRIPEPSTPIHKGLILALDSIRDPGNLGTLIRLCDWFGVDQLWCSPDTADCYNPKVVQASMGSIARVKIIYSELEPLLSMSELPVYGGCMDGESVYSTKLSNSGILVVGNEANGISNGVMNLLDHKITIPQFGKRQDTESLNAATATAILLSEFKRSTGK